MSGQAQSLSSYVSSRLSIGQALARKANLTALQGALDDLQKLQESVTEDNETGADVRVLRESRLRAGLHAENLCRRREISGVS